MTALIAGHAWERTSLGPTASWPQSLTAVVNLVTASPQAMIVLWGPDLIQIYNDAYAVICGARHPKALGQATRDCWPEVWPFNEPVYAAVMLGEARSFPRQMLTILRHGALEDAWFDLTFSALRDDGGAIAGVLVTVVEISAQVLAEASLTDQVTRQHRLFQQSPGFVCILHGPEHVYEFANAAYERLVGRDDLVGKTVRDALPDIAGQGFYELLDSVYSTGERFKAEHVLVRIVREPGRPPEERFVDFVYEPVIGVDGGVTGVFTQGHDVTDAHLAGLAKALADRRQIFRSDLDEAFRNLADPRDVIATAAEHLGLALGASRCGFAEIDEAMEFLTVLRDWTDGTLSSGAGRFRMSDFGEAFMDEMTAGRVVRLDDSLADPLTTGDDIAAANAALDFRAVLAVPILKAGRWVAAILVHEASPRAWSDEDATLVMEVAERTWATVGRARAEALQRDDAEFLRSVLASSNDCIKVLDLDAGLLFMNEAGQRLMEISDFNAVEGCPWPEFWEGQGGLDARAAVEAAHAGKAGRFTGQTNTPSGAPMWWDVQVTPILGSDGRPERLLVVSRDISTQKAAELALRDSEAQFRSALTTAQLGTFEWDQSTGAVILDGRSREIFGFMSDQILMDQDVFDRIDPRDFGEVRERAGESGRTRSRLELEYRINLPGGVERIVASTSEVVARPDGDRLVGVFADATYRRAAERALRDLNADLERQVVERAADLNRTWQNSHDILVVAGADGVLRAVNPAWTRILGYETSETVGHGFNDFIWTGDARMTQAAFEMSDIVGQVAGLEIRHLHKDGTPRCISWQAVTEGDSIYGYARDITEERARDEELRGVEAHLRQAQKMEAVGQLTGGIAHDFNNMLTGVIGGLDIVQRRLADGRHDDLDRFIDMARESGERAASLTRRLLAFSRLQSLDLKVLDVNVLALGMQDMLRRALNETLDLTLTVQKDVWPVEVDASQVENALLNLVINARDAMPDGGAISIETANVTVTEAEKALREDLPPGDYVRIRVSDQGVGMSEMVQARAFDPFFTTKAIGQGTGLGLSMIYGFAKQSNGHVAIASEPGRGTTVTLWLPRAAKHVAADVAPRAVDLRPPRAGATVMIVEDEPAVRLLITEILTELGYDFVEAAHGVAALPILRSTQRIDLLVTDVGLPGMNGHQLAQMARELRPDLKVLFVTGYAEQAADRGAFLNEGMDMVAKPFDIDALGRKIESMVSQEVAVVPDDSSGREP